MDVCGLRGDVVFRRRRGNGRPQWRDPTDIMCQLASEYAGQRNSFKLNEGAATQPGLKLPQSNRIRAATVAGLRPYMIHSCASTVGPPTGVFQSSLRGSSAVSLAGFFDMVNS